MSAAMAVLLFISFVWLSVGIVRTIFRSLRKRSATADPVTLPKRIAGTLGTVAILSLTVPVMLGIGYNSALAVTPLTSEEIAQAEIRAEQRQQERAERAAEKAERDAASAAEKQLAAEKKEAERAERDARRAAEREQKAAERAERDAASAAERATRDAERQAAREQKEAEQARQEAADRAKQAQETAAARNSSNSASAPSARAQWEAAMREDGWFKPTDGIWFQWATDYTCGYFNCIYAYVAVEETCMGGVVANVAIFRGNVSIGSDLEITSALIKRGSTLPIAEVSFTDISNNGDSWELTGLRCMRR